jgi:hypothetical protein
MTNEAKIQKIMSAINSRGWWPLGVYQKECEALQVEGAIKVLIRRSQTGSSSCVWVKA